MDDSSVQQTVQRVEKLVDTVAKSLGVAAGELWSIFVRQYFVRGLSEAFTGIVLVVAAYYLGPIVGYYALIPAGLSLVFFYGAIALLGNPKYYAVQDIAKRLNEAKGLWH